MPWSVDWRVLQDCLNVNGNATNLARNVHSIDKNNEHIMFNFEGVEGREMNSFGSLMPRLQEQRRGLWEWVWILPSAVTFSVWVEELSCRSYKRLSRLFFLVYLLLSSFVEIFFLRVRFLTSLVFRLFAFHSSFFFVYSFLCLLSDSSEQSLSLDFYQASYATTYVTCFTAMNMSQQFVWLFVSFRLALVCFIWGVCLVMTRGYKS